MVDFYCPKAKLIIELDGGQHYSEAVQAKDESRDRFSDKEVFENLRGVFEEIWNHA